MLVSCYYILFSRKLNKFYVGSTVSFPERLIEYDTCAYGASIFTAASDDWEEFMVTDCRSSIEQSKKLEAHIKRMKSRKYIRDLKIYPEEITKLKGKHRSV